MKKIFGGINLTWKIVIISAILIGIAVGLLNSVPALYDTTITDIATYFDFWIFCGIFIIMNSKFKKLIKLIILIPYKERRLLLQGHFLNLEIILKT